MSFRGRPRGAPTKPAAKPTFVQSDTCGAFLVDGGVSVRTLTPKDCEIQVTLANGDVLTSTASFKALPNCCTPGLSLASASPFQTAKASQRDAAAPDGSQSALLLDEWWYPECGTPANNGPDTCRPVQLIAASSFPPGSPAVLQSFVTSPPWAMCPRSPRIRDCRTPALRGAQSRPRSGRSRPSPSERRPEGTECLENPTDTATAFAKDVATLLGAPLN